MSRWPKIATAWQSALKAASLYDGALDGIRGPKTQHAIWEASQWQRALVDHGFGRLAIDGWPGTETRAAAAACRNWQEWLNEKGFTAGRVDGFPGPLTVGAIKRFQRAAGVVDDGEIGPITAGARRLWPARAGSAIKPPADEDKYDKIRRLALAQVGDPYVYGAEVNLSDANPTAFDCSELVEWLFWQAEKVDVGDWTVAQERAFTEPLDVPEKAGDVFFMGRTGSSFHMGICIGNGEVVEARGRAYGTVKTTVAAVNARGAWWRRKPGW